MSTFRITQRTLTSRVESNLQASLAEYQRLQEHLSSGKAIQAPSDSPTGSVAALRYRAELRRAEQFKRNADDASGWLGTADTTLTDMLQLINRARGLVQGAVNGAIGQAERDAIAAEMDGLREGALSLANATFLGRPIFAGTAEVSRSYDTAGNYVGDGGVVNRPVAQNSTVTVNLLGPQVFGPAGADVFADLAQAAADLRANADLSSAQDRLSGAFDRVNENLATVGSRFHQVETLKARVEGNVIDTNNALAEVESIDLPATIVALRLQETAYQAALAATARVVQPSLVDFLR